MWRNGRKRVYQSSQALACLVGSQSRKYTTLGRKKQKTLCNREGRRNAGWGEGEQGGGPPREDRLNKKEVVG